MADEHGLTRKARRAARDLLLPLFDAVNRATFTREQREAARKRDPDYDKAAAHFDAEVDAHHREMMEDERAADALKLRKKK